MKKMKKFFAVILSLAMVLGMSITAFATEAGTATQAAGKITVEKRRYNCKNLQSSFME